MNSRVFAPILFVGSLAFACGPHPRSAESSMTTAAAVGGKSNAGRVGGSSAALRRKAAPDEQPIATALAVTLGGDSTDRTVTFALRVTNTTDKQLELDFPSGQTHDFVVLDAGGRELWRWSAARMFTQTVQNKLLGSRETVAYQERWHSEAAHGRLTAVAVLNSSNFKREKRVEFTLP